MKRIISILLAISMILCFAIPAAAEETTNNDLFSDFEKVKVERTGKTVSLTLPESMFEPSEEEMYGEASITVNDDETVTITMQEEDYAALLEIIAEQYDENLAEFVDGETTPYIKEIKRNDDFSEIQVLVNRKLYENSFDFSFISFVMVAFIYQGFAGMEPNTTLTYIDVDTSEIINTTVYPVEE